MILPLSLDSKQRRKSYENQALYHVYHFGGCHPFEKVFGALINDHQPIRALRQVRRRQARRQPRRRVRRLSPLIRKRLTQRIWNPKIHFIIYYAWVRLVIRFFQVLPKIPLYVVYSY